jgi:hypothetical protein
MPRETPTAIDLVVEGGWNGPGNRHLLTPQSSDIQIKIQPWYAHIYVHWKRGAILIWVPLLTPNISRFTTYELASGRDGWANTNRQKALAYNARLDNKHRQRTWVLEGRLGRAWDTNDLLIYW